MVINALLFVFVNSISKAQYSDRTPDKNRFICICYFQDDLTPKLDKTNIQSPNHGDMAVSNTVGSIVFFCVLVYRVFYRKRLLIAHSLSKSPAFRKVLSVRH